MKDKKKAVRILAGFLSFMLVMTFVSRGVYAKSLPTVKVKEAKCGRLSRMLRCGGTVVPTAVKGVQLPEGLTVEQVDISAGCKAEKGDQLMKLDVSQLKEKAEALESEIAEMKESAETANNDGTPVFTEPDMPVSRVNVKKGDTVSAGDVLFTVDTGRLLRLINELETERNSDIINRGGCIAAAESADSSEGMEDTASQQRTQAAVYDCNIEQKQEKIDRYLEVYNNGGRVCAPCGGTVTAVKVGSGDLTGQSAAVLIGESDDESCSVKSREKLLDTYRALIEDDGAVMSTVDGTVTAVDVAAGQQTTSSAAVCIADNSRPVYFRAELTEEEAKQISAGDSADIALHNGRQVLSGCRISSVVRQSGTGYTAIVPIDSEDALSGDIGELRIQVNSEDSSICVPSGAIYGDRQKYVFILKKEEGFLGEEYRAERIEVTTSSSNETMTALSSGGLSEGDKVICTDKKLTDGQTVRYTEE
ncbi:biotin/lipoyl-binding protein [uncultured Ruminococcus sp.]|uniref:biotin/lipoyl-binding protein n=1 Tax=uncultured Ruminococcus sp. TaxID=165186 RepID=UPI0025F8E3EA|nr:biotin/lipoyl-binding protein [uncultured Ruminococcus sp.]